MGTTLPASEDHARRRSWLPEAPLVRTAIAVLGCWAFLLGGTSAAWAIGSSQAFAAHTLTGEVSSRSGDEALLALGGSQDATATYEITADLFALPCPGAIYGYRGTRAEIFGSVFLVFQSTLRVVAARFSRGLRCGRRLPVTAGRGGFRFSMRTDEGLSAVSAAGRRRTFTGFEGRLRLDRALCERRYRIDVRLSDGSGTVRRLRYLVAATIPEVNGQRGCRA